MKNYLFLTNKNALYSNVTGGVQICSQEFHFILSKIPNAKLSNYYVPFTRNIFQRLKIRIGLENYSMYDVKFEANKLLSHIEKEEISAVFLNMASIIRFSEPIKKRFGDNVKVVLLSHGNHSGDFLHLISKPIRKENRIKHFIKKIRLGNLISTESYFRVKYLDAVLTISETEKHIENWFGSKKTVFIPRRLSDSFVKHKPVVNRIGFVGRLDHPPNLQGLKLLLEEFLTKKKSNIEVRLVGSPANYGQEIQQTYPFIKYLGELSDLELEEEITTWAIFLNPVWWYSTGASTKLGKAISWGIPIITTTPGMRGYEWKSGEILTADTPEDMVDAIIENVSSIEKISFWSNQIRVIAKNGLSDEDLIEKIKGILI